MARHEDPSDTQKNILIALTEGWRLRYIEEKGWYLFQPQRERPFCSVKARTVRKMTDAGFLSPGTTTQGLGYRPGKALTSLGIQIGSELIHEDWPETYQWEPAAGDTNLDVEYRHAA